MPRFIGKDGFLLQIDMIESEFKKTERVEEEREKKKTSEETLLKAGRENL